MQEDDNLKTFIVTYIDSNNERKIMKSVWFKNFTCKEFKEYLEKHLDIIKIINVYPDKETKESSD